MTYQRPILWMVRCRVDVGDLHSQRMNDMKVVVKMLLMLFHVVRGASSFTTRSTTTRLGHRAFSPLLLRHASSRSDPAGSPKKKKNSSTKFTINQKTTPDQARKLAAAFDQLARKEGFGRSDALFVSDEDFDDDFADDYYEKLQKNRRVDKAGDQDFVDPSHLNDNPDSTDASDLDDEGNSGPWSDDVDSIDFGGSSGESMDDRIASAKRDMDLGRVTVPEDLDMLAQTITPRTLRDLGFRRELNPFEGDQTPRQARFKLVTNAMDCPACGSEFQMQDEKRPGYLPPHKFEIQQKLHKIHEMRKLQEKAISADWSPEDEIEWLIQTDGKSGREPNLEAIDLDAMAESLGIDLDQIESKPVFCQRCHGLQNSGKINESLRPGWSEDPLLSQSRFRKLLRPLSEKKAVIVALVDLFDFSGSVLPELDRIAGTNPVIVAANKADLLPSKMGPVRVQNWVRRELQYLGVKSLANIGGAVRLVSCKTGMGVFSMLDKARELAERMECDIYLVGAANAGKSTLLNFVLRNRYGYDIHEKKRAGNMNKFKGAVTTSPLPGTTLKFIKVSLFGGGNLYDTPGLLVPGTLTQMLTPEELKIAVPKKQVEPLTLRVENGKCVLVGGLARVALVGDSRPFFFTFFVSNDIKIHKTDLSKAEEVRRKHAGGILTPPLPPVPERTDEIGDFEHHDLEIKGSGWKEAGADIALTGLGWVAVTGAGIAKVQISVPKGIAVTVRPPLMPFDLRDSTARYTGSRSVRSTGRKRRGRGISGVGRK